ncbi:MAG: helix-turn-helix domain-containing protein [archaeon]|jgi:sugar-specific transcriptional regulator TrmB
MGVEKLVELGLTKAEALVYYAVLKLNDCTAREISKECGFHRTNIYDVLEQLREKGLVTIFKEGKTTRYHASDPNNLYAFIKEKEELLGTFLPELQDLFKSQKSEILVEVYKGPEGMKSAWREMIQVGRPIYAYGVKGQLREKLPLFGEKWIREMKSKKIPYYGIYTKKGNNPVYFTELRYVSEEFSGPVATFIYGNTVNINIWEPNLVAIVIRSELVASMFRKHFGLLWKIAKP